MDQQDLKVFRVFKELLARKAYKGYQELMGQLVHKAFRE